MGCLMTIIGFFVLLWAAITFEAASFGFPLIIAYIICKQVQKIYTPSPMWKISTYAVGLISTIMVLLSVFREDINMGPYPLAIVVVYGLLSYFYYWAKENQNRMLFSNSIHPCDEDDEENTEDLDDSEQQAKQLCRLLRDKIAVENDFWKEAHLEFEYNLVTSYTSLQLNFEIRNRSGIPWHDSGGGITIKANVYDTQRNLLCVEDVFVEDKELARGRYSDFLYFDFDEIKCADSIEIYAY